MNPIQRLKNWTMRLPNVWGLGQAQIHSSLFIMLGLLAVLVAGVSLSRPGLMELFPAAVTLPVVWLISLVVRVAAQQLVLGENHLDLETTVGPSGHMSTDYEYLPAKQILFYSLAGPLATFGLALLGFIVSAAMAQVTEGELTTARLLDLKGGWHSAAWASQIMWVNLFLGLLHLLPTVPFDMRATIFAILSMRYRTAQEPDVFRGIARLITNLSFLLLGVGVTALCLSWSLHREILGWYAAFAGAVYLFVASQWEISRADELEEQYSPVPTRQHHSGHFVGPRQPHWGFGATDREPSLFADDASGRVDASLGKDLDAEAAPDLGPVEEDYVSENSIADLDEILRKLHREGRQALSTDEQEALLSASRELKEKRGQTN